MWKRRITFTSLSFHWGNVWCLARLRLWGSWCDSTQMVLFRSCSPSTWTVEESVPRNQQVLTDFSVLWFLFTWTHRKVVHFNQPSVSCQNFSTALNKSPHWFRFHVREAGANQTTCFWESRGFWNPNQTLYGFVQGADTTATSSTVWGAASTLYPTNHPPDGKVINSTLKC